MNPDAFFKNFEFLADAPNGVQKLRELILQLAVMGKLVPQDLNDEPASIFDNETNEKKEWCTTEGKTRKSQKISEEEIPYELPDTWKWMRLSDISYDLGQKKPDVKFTYIDVTSINKELGLISEDLKILNPEDAPSRARKIVKNGTVIYSTVRPYLLNIAIVDKDFDPEPIVSTAFAILHPYSGILNKYLYHYLRSKPFISYVESEMTGMAYPAINDTKLYKGLIPLPPLAEQKRIVSKVDELMALCNKLETRRQKKQEIQSKLNSAALDRMLSAENQEEFEQNWQRICENFDLLYDNPENVEKLKQAILQLAVQGKLVSQNPEDEPAEILLEKIRGEKERLVKEGIIKNFKPLPPIEENEIPYELPKEWQWVRLEDLVSLLGDGLHGTPEYSDLGDYFFINGNNLSDGKIIVKNDTKRVANDEYNKYKKELNERTVLVSINGTLGNVAFYNNERVILGKSACYFNLLHEINKYYLKFLINTSYFLEYAFKNATGTTIKNVSLKSMRLFLVPLPPLAEQKRIVEKVEQFMGLCDELESKLRKEREDNEKLMEAVVKGLLEGAVAEKPELDKPIPLRAAVVKLK